MRITSKKITNYLIDKLNKKEEEYKRVMNIAPDGSDALCERKIDEERDYLDYKAKNQDEYRYAKLGQLENIEDELGIDLITLFKAYSNGFYVKGETEKQYIDFENSLNAIAFKNKEMFYGHKWTYQYVKLYDYGKTWALTKEELE